MYGGNGISPCRSSSSSAACSPTAPTSSTRNVSPASVRSPTTTTASPADKLIDRLRPEFGLRGHIVGFKYEDAATVEASALRLLERVGAAAVLANSLCGSVQALVTPAGGRRAADRDEGLRLLVDRVPHEEGKTFHPELLMLGGDGDPKLGSDLKGQQVTVKVAEHVRAADSVCAVGARHGEGMSEVASDR